MQQWQQQLQRLEQWWQTPSGHSLLQFELAYLSKRLQHLFGYRLILLATDAFTELSNETVMSHVLRIDPLSDDMSQLVGKANDIDAVIVPHVFAFLPNLSEVLLSLNHQLQDHGKLIITGFHHRSWLGLQQLLWQKSVRSIPKPNSSMASIKELLVENNFVITRDEHFAACKLGKNMLIQKRHLEAQWFGNLTCFVCQKQLAPVKSMKTQWQSSASAKAIPVQTYIGEHDEN